jgi:alpha-L-rhamnosidase
MVASRRWALSRAGHYQRAYYWTHDVTGSYGEAKRARGVVADGRYSGYIGFGLLTGIGTEKSGATPT